jgi:hypothetical protein
VTVCIHTVCIYRLLVVASHNFGYCLPLTSAKFVTQSNPQFYKERCKLKNNIQVFNILCTRLSGAHQVWCKPTETDFPFFLPSLPHFVIRFIYQFPPPLRTHFPSLLSFFSLRLFTAYLLLPFFSVTSFSPLFSLYSHAYLVHLSLFPAFIPPSLNFPLRLIWVFASSLD